MPDDAHSMPEDASSARSGKPRDPVPSKKSKARTWWKLRAKHYSDDQKPDWWFASTAIPLLAATLGPLANILSIGALVTSWRMQVIDDEGQELGDLNGIVFADPRWCISLNAVSLALGFTGNFFLLMNFTQRIRYIIALPFTIILWFLASGILMGILICMEIYVPPNRPEQTYSQGFWYGVAAACVYFVSSFLLTFNMLGYFLGHYPQTFELSDPQRTLILQTMLFFIWLAGGGGVFSRVETNAGTPGWGFTDAMYYCDVTILTVGFGDLAPKSDLGRGLVFPYSVGGIIMLGLVISSIHKFATELGAEKVVKGRFEKNRARMWNRSVRTSGEFERRKQKLEQQTGRTPVVLAPSDTAIPSMAPEGGPHQPATSGGTGSNLLETVTNPLAAVARVSKKPKVVLLREERDRFNAMRSIQLKTSKFKKWWRLIISTFAFGLLWAGGAIVFWRTERVAQGMTYFQALYFCYVCLLTIGYGDLSPQTNPGRCFFVVWSLIAVPTMTILISDMGETVISNFNKGTFKIADFTVLPKSGIGKMILDNNSRVATRIKRWVDARARKKRHEKGLPGPPAEDSDDLDEPAPDIESIAAAAEQDDRHESSESDLAHRLSRAIRRTANDLKTGKPKRYTYEEWAEFTRLIRFTSRLAHNSDEQEEEHGAVEWDWIGEDSPMMAQQSEPEFVLDKLCESLARYIKKHEVTEGGIDPPTLPPTTKRKTSEQVLHENGSDNASQPQKFISPMS